MTTILKHLPVGQRIGIAFSGGPTPVQHCCGCDKKGLSHMHILRIWASRMRMTMTPFLAVQWNMVLRMLAR